MRASDAQAQAVTPEVAGSSPVAPVIVTPPLSGVFCFVGCKVMRTVHALGRLAFRPMSALTSQRDAAAVHLFPRIHRWAMTSREGVGLDPHERREKEF